MKLAGVAVLTVVLVVLIFIGGYCMGVRGSDSAIRTDIQCVSKNVDDKVADLHRRFDSINVGLGGLDKRFNAVDADFDIVNKRFNAIDAKLDIILSLATNNVMRDTRSTK